VRPLAHRLREQACAAGALRPSSVSGQTSERVDEAMEMPGSGETAMRKMSRNELLGALKRERPPRLIEVLDPEAFGEEHLPGAQNVPLGDAFAERIRHTVPDLHQPVVVYCANTECSASDTAARRLEELGYENVYDFEEGKAGWKAAGLPTEA
jgi:rhodanese-related sulfurtransferase